MTLKIRNYVVNNKSKHIKSIHVCIDYMIILALDFATNRSRTEKEKKKKNYTQIDKINLFFLVEQQRKRQNNSQNKDLRKNSFFLVWLIGDLN